MENLFEYVSKNYSFLIENNYEIDQITGINKGVSVINLKGTSGLIFCFIQEYDTINLSLTSTYILENVKYGAYDKYIEMFYAVRLINAVIKFDEINLNSYPVLVKDNLAQLETLFSNENIEETVKKIKVIAKNYEKVRWETK